MSENFQNDKHKKFHHNSRSIIAELGLNPLRACLSKEHRENKNIPLIGVVAPGAHRDPVHVPHVHFVLIGFIMDVFHRSKAQDEFLIRHLTELPCGASDVDG